VFPSLVSLVCGLPIDNWSTPQCLPLPDDALLVADLPGTDLPSTDLSSTDRPRPCQSWIKCSTMR
jgi:hypothetical protein